MSQRLLIIGNGMASVRLVETLVRIAPERFAITVVGGEPQPGYNRVLLSALLAQDVTAEDVILRDRAWYESYGRPRRWHQASISFSTNAFSPRDRIRFACQCPAWTNPA
jgi:NAD(P)H-nitrite reductase large subunit